MKTDSESSSSSEQNNPTTLRHHIGRVLPDSIRRNLTAKLLVLLLVLSVVSGGVVVLSYTTINDDITDQVRAQVSSDTTIQATIYENWLSERWRTLNEITDSSEMEHDSKAVVHQWLTAEQTRISNDVHSLHVANADTGEVLGSTDTEYHGINFYEMGLSKTNVGSLIFISQKPIKLGEELPEMTLIGTHSGDRMLIAAIPRETTLVESRPFENAKSSLISLEGHQVLGDEIDSTIQIHDEEHKKTVVINGEDTIIGVHVIAHDLLDAQSVERYDETTTVGTAVVTRAPKAEAFAIRDQVSENLAISFGLALTLLIGTAAVIMRSVTLDINRLSKRARRISDGSFDVDVSSNRIDEIGILFQSVGEMRDSLRERIEQAERREQLMTEAREDAEQARKTFRQIIDLVPDLIFAKNRTGEYLIANEATANAYGVSVEEVEGRTESAIIPNQDDAEQFQEDDLDVIESGESKFISEEELTTADGETRILQTTKVPFNIPGRDEDAVLGYSRDVTDLKRYERQIEEQRDNLEVLNQMVRHDIRNKLHLISAYTEMTQSYVDGEGTEYLENVIEATIDAVDITETARDVTQVMLQSDVEHFPVSLQYVLEEEIDTIRSSHDRALVSLEDSIPDIEVLADGMLESMFRNLLHNAIQHNDKDVPEVTVSATLEGDYVEVRIADNGPGIPDEQKDVIFQEGEVGLESDGTGLGLYLVETLVDRYGGTVRVEDNEPSGSVFVVKLPIAQ